MVPELFVSLELALCKLVRKRYALDRQLGRFRLEIITKKKGGGVTNLVAVFSTQNQNSIMLAGSCFVVVVFFSQWKCNILVFQKQVNTSIVVKLEKLKLQLKKWFLNCVCLSSLCNALHLKLGGPIFSSYFGRLISRAKNKSKTP